MKISETFLEKSTQFSKSIDLKIDSLDKNLTLMTLMTFSGFISQNNSSFIDNLYLANLALDKVDYLVYLNLAKAHVLMVKTQLDFIQEKKLANHKIFTDFIQEAATISSTIQELISKIDK